MKRLQIVLPLLLALFVSACSEEVRVDPPKLGEKVTDASFVGLDKGVSTTLSEHQGKLVMVHFWATWCAPCRKEMPSLESLSKKLDPNKFVLIGVSVDEDVNLVKEFKIKYGINFAKYIDLEMTLAKGHFAATAFPETFLIDRDGKLVRRMVGEHEWDTPAMLKVLNDAYGGVETKAGAYW